MNTPDRYHAEYDRVLKFSADHGPALLSYLHAHPDDHNHRLVTADWMQEQGRGEEEGLLRDLDQDVRVHEGKVVPRLPAPLFHTTVEQHHGGNRRSLQTVTTAFPDFSQEAWDDLDHDQQTYWHDTLSNYHDAAVRLAEQPPHVREEVDTLLAHHGFDNPDDVASFVHNHLNDIEDTE